MLNDPNDQLADGTFALVQIHIGGDGLPSWAGRASFYGVAGAPVAVFDGALLVAGTSTDVQTQFDIYLGKYGQRRAVPTDVTITATGTEDSGPTYVINARVCLEPGGTAKTLRIYMVQDLDYYGCTYCRYTFMQAGATQDITLQPGQCAVISRSFTFDSTSWAARTDIKMVIWAQEPQSSGLQNDPAEVFQACTMHWPFPADCNVNGIPDGDDIAGGTSQDCNANAIPDECDIANGTSEDANSNAIPDECEIVTGDLNCDGSVDFGDINPFVLLITDPQAWQTAYPGCLLGNGDCNVDGVIGFADINPFIALLTG